MDKYARVKILYLSVRSFRQTLTWLREMYKLRQMQWVEILFFNLNISYNKYEKTTCLSPDGLLTTLSFLGTCCDLEIPKILTINIYSICESDAFWEYCLDNPLHERMVWYDDMTTWITVWCKCDVVWIYQIHCSLEAYMS